MTAHVIDFATRRELELKYDGAIPPYLISAPEDRSRLQGIIAQIEKEESDARAYEQAAKGTSIEYWRNRHLENARWHRAAAERWRVLADDVRAELAAK